MGPRQEQLPNLVKEWMHRSLESLDVSKVNSIIKEFGRGETDTIIWDKDFCGINDCIVPFGGKASELGLRVFEVYYYSDHNNIISIIDDPNSQFNGWGLTFAAHKYVIGSTILTSLIKFRIVLSMGAQPYKDESEVWGYKSRDRCCIM